MSILDDEIDIIKETDIVGEIPEFNKYDTYERESKGLYLPTLLYIKYFEIYYIKKNKKDWDCNYYNWFNEYFYKDVVFEFSWQRNFYKWKENWEVNIGVKYKKDRWVQDNVLRTFNIKNDCKSRKEAQQFAYNLMKKVHNDPHYIEEVFENWKSYLIFNPLGGCSHSEGVDSIVTGSFSHAEGITYHNHLSHMPIYSSIDN